MPFASWTGPNGDGCKTLTSQNEITLPALGCNPPGKFGARHDHGSIWGRTGSMHIHRATVTGCFLAMDCPLRFDDSPSQRSCVQGPIGDNILWI